MANSTTNIEMQMQLALATYNEFDNLNFSAIVRQFPPVNCQR